MTSSKNNAPERMQNSICQVPVQDCWKLFLALYLMIKKRSPLEGMPSELSSSESIQLIYKEIKEIGEELANINCIRSRLTKKEPADYLKISLRTIENLVSSGDMFPIIYDRDYSQIWNE